MSSLPSFTDSVQPPFLFHLLLCLFFITLFSLFPSSVIPSPPEPPFPTSLFLLFLGHQPPLFLALLSPHFLLSSRFLFWLIMAPVAIWFIFRCNVTLVTCWFPQPLSWFLCTPRVSSAVALAEHFQSLAQLWIYLAFGLPTSLVAAIDLRKRPFLYSMDFLTHGSTVRTLIRFLPVPTGLVWHFQTSALVFQIGGYRSSLCVCISELDLKFGIGAVHGLCIFATSLATSSVINPSSNFTCAPCLVLIQLRRPAMPSPAGCFWAKDFGMEGVSVAVRRSPLLPVCFLDPIIHVGYASLFWDPFLDVVACRSDHRSSGSFLLSCYPSCGFKFSSLFKFPLVFYLRDTRALLVMYPTVRSLRISVSIWKAFMPIFRSMWFVAHCSTIIASSPTCSSSSDE